MRIAETKQREYLSKYIDTVKTAIPETLKSITLSFCSRSVVVAGGDVVFLRGHLEEIRVQPDTAAPVKHDSGMNGGF